MLNTLMENEIKRFRYFDPFRYNFYNEADCPN